MVNRPIELSRVLLFAQPFTIDVSFIELPISKDKAFISIPHPSVIYLSYIIFTRRSGLEKLKNYL
jgi:hypothetical protein